LAFAAEEQKEALAAPRELARSNDALLERRPLPLGTPSGGQSGLASGLGDRRRRAGLVHLSGPPIGRRESGAHASRAFNSALEAGAARVVNGEIICRFQTMIMPMIMSCCSFDGSGSRGEQWRPVQWLQCHCHWRASSESEDSRREEFSPNWPCSQHWTANVARRERQGGGTGSLRASQSLGVRVCGRGPLLRPADRGHAARACGHCVAEWERR